MQKIVGLLIVLQTHFYTVGMEQLTFTFDDPIELKEELHSSFTEAYVNLKEGIEQNDYMHVATGLCALESFDDVQKVDTYDSPLCILLTHLKKEHTVWGNGEDKEQKIKNYISIFTLLTHYPVIFSTQWKGGYESLAALCTPDIPSVEMIVKKIVKKTPEQYISHIIPLFLASMHNEELKEFLRTYAQTYTQYTNEPTLTRGIGSFFDWWKKRKIKTAQVEVVPKKTEQEIQQEVQMAVERVTTLQKKIVRAIYGKNLDTLNQLLKNEHAQINHMLYIEESGLGYTPLTYALCGYFENRRYISSLASEQGAEAETIEGYKREINFYKQAIVALLLKGAKVDMPYNSAGDTPLIGAVKQQDTLLMQLLLFYGANPLLPGKNGVTPLVLAQELPDQGIYIRLISHLNALPKK